MDLDAAKAIVSRTFPKLVAWRNRRRGAIARSINYHGITMELPANHILLSVLKHQPRRHESVRLSAAHIFRKHPAATFVDIGANVGDTAVVVRSVSNCPMILVEPSDVYLPYLKRNAARLGPGVKVVHGFFITRDDLNARFDLVHSAGTARPERASLHSDGAPNYDLDKLTNQPVKLIKIDTDGYDRPLIQGYKDDFGRRGMNVLFELEVRSGDDVRAWTNCLADLLRRDYAGLLIWDDPGHFMCSVRVVDLADQLMGWLLSHSSSDSGRRPRRIYNFDVLAVTQEDEDVLRAIEEDYRAAIGASVPRFPSSPATDNR
jgi:FkbM family methyltransferase